MADVAFSKHVGLEVTERAKSRWVFRKLGNFRAGPDAAMAFLERTRDLDRSNRSGVEHFDAHVGGSVLSCDVLILAGDPLAT